MTSTWRAERGLPSLPEVHRSVGIDARGSRLRRFFAFAGPGYLIAVGYMDPGNWATGVAAGSAFGYELLWVIVLSNAMAIVLQTLAARLGIATGRDLAQACRDSYPRPVVRLLWILCELSICATDLAEIVGTAIALKLLLGIPIGWGVVLTALDVLLVLWLQGRGMRYLEASIAALLALVLACFAFELVIARPDLAAIAGGLLPDPRAGDDPGRLYLAVGIIGATVMPHNLYLHSSLVQTRRYALDDAGRGDAIRFATADLVAALFIAVMVNGAILILAAAALHVAGHPTELQDAYQLLSPVLGVSAAGLVFGIALLASGKSSTLTATLSGQIVMEGFLALSLPAWARRLVTRAVAIIPALLVVIACGESGLSRLLVLSQAVLSLQLPFAVIPLIRLTSDRSKMGRFASPRWLSVTAWLVALTIILLNSLLLLQLAA